MTRSPLVIAIDGPSGVGKSTVGRVVARSLQLPFLETGAMYRALGWKLLEEGIDIDNQGAVEARAEALDLVLHESADGEVEILLDGVALDDRIREPQVSEATSVVSSYAGVRQRMVELQRQFGQRRGAVVEGRDIGTRVFPDTPFKFYLEAPLAVRVNRRKRQLEASGERSVSSVELEAEVAQRDFRDSSRKESPLRVDSSYTVIDTGVDDAAAIAEQIVTRVKASASRSRADDC